MWSSFTPFEACTKSFCNDQGKILLDILLMCCVFLLYLCTIQYKHQIQIMAIECSIVRFRFVCLSLLFQSMTWNSAFPLTVILLR